MKRLAAIFAGMSGRLRWLRSKPVSWTFAVTILRTAGFLLVLPIALRTLSPREMGLWYVILGVSQLSSICELGFAPTIMRFAGYFMGGARGVPSLGLSPEAPGATANFAGLAGLVVMSRRLYASIAAAMGLIMTLGGGSWLFWKYPAEAINPYYAGAFLLYLAGSIFNMFGFFWPALLYGVNRVLDSQKAFIHALLLNYLVTLGGLLLGFGLYALAAGQIVLGLYPWWRARRIIQTDYLSQAVGYQTVVWRDLWPMTWRSGLASFAGYLSLPATTLLCAQLLDLETTASYGLSLQLALVLHTTSQSWLTAAYPRINSLRARGEKDQIVALVRLRLALCLATFLLGAGIVTVAAPHLLHVLGSRTHFLPPLLLAALLVVVGIDLWVGLHAAILQTANHTPHLRIAVSTGVLTIILALVLGDRWGAAGLIFAIGLAQLSLGSWLTPLLCWRDLSKKSTKSPSLRYVVAFL